MEKLSLAGNMVKVETEKEQTLRHLETFASNLMADNETKAIGSYLLHNLEILKG